MPIFQKGAAGVTSLNAQPFATERGLELAIVETPNLLKEPDGPDPAYVAQPGWSDSFSRATSTGHAGLNQCPRPMRTLPGSPGR